MSADVPSAALPGSGDRYGRRFLLLWLLASLIVTPIVAIFVGPAIPPGNGSVQASGQVLDNTVLLSVLTPILLFVLLFVGFALTHFGARDSEADGPPDRGTGRIQIVWAVVTTVTAMVLATFGSYELVQDGAGGGQGPNPSFVPPGSSSAMNVQVIGQQWEFTYRYPSYGGIESAQLVLPANRLVRLHVTSLDVVHSFWAYQLGVKADANPGVDNIVYVQLKGPRTFNIRCAELCGLWHGYMYDTGRVVPQAEFNRWIAGEEAVYAPIAKYLPPYSLTYLPEPTRRAG